MSNYIEYGNKIAFHPGLLISILFNTKSNKFNQNKLGSSLR